MYVWEVRYQGLKIACRRQTVLATDAYSPSLHAPYSPPHPINTHLQPTLPPPHPHHHTHIYIEYCFRLIQCC